MLDLVKQRLSGSEISELLVFSTSTHDSYLHKILDETVSDLLTSEDLRQAGSYQRFSTGHGDPILEVSVQPNKTVDNIDPIFSAVRGATLYGLQPVLNPVYSLAVFWPARRKRKSVGDVFGKALGESRRIHTKACQAVMYSTGRWNRAVWFA
jgi:hypothetical protein